MIHCPFCKKKYLGRYSLSIHLSECPEKAQVDEVIKTKQKTRIDCETVCLTCKMFFTIHGIDIELGKEAGSGFAVSNLECPNCGLKTLDFDLVRVEDKPSMKEIIKFREASKKVHISKALKRSLTIKL